ncbi:uncharacterized protein STEHIDRAFT_112518 [Stereum hirsutum FP-91666 SS1]|uniref:uncharacterized protein n=1 Tax=Stereum hirsutum (strain FP-91666) TaxID=721885 RepID=UPI000444A7B1|nr:uncharacterized protein STEHIDRAFT_112518 [Stereum hirsutum FP-91666 SS1]EIM85024.1 hypothetical protein STEHIDRAFT_112518 [Stereum hirsutum FP-91666 SS1]
MFFLSFIFTSTWWAFLAQPTAAYTWAFDNSPTQCGPLAVSILDDTGGNPPYNLLIVPHGPTPLAIEPRTVQTLTFNTNTELNFTLKYPARSQLVAVMSDQSGFASGGTSAAWTVEEPAPGIPLCFDQSRNESQPWDFDISPQSADSSILISCGSYTLEWNTGDGVVTGTPNFVGIIPSGESFNISGTPHNGPPQGLDWIVPLNPGTDFILVAGDQSATGSGGTVNYGIEAASSPPSTACPAQLFSTTSGTPAGGPPTSSVSLSTGSIPKSTATSSIPPESTDHKPNIGAIAGGAAGGGVAISIAFLSLILCLRRHRKRREQIDLDGPPVFITNELEVPPVTSVRPTSFNPSMLYANPEMTYLERPESEAQASSSSSAPPAVNNTKRKLPVQSPRTSSGSRTEIIIRHVDSGRVEMPEVAERPATIELPPLYDASLKD